MKFYKFLSISLISLIMSCINTIFSIKVINQSKILSGIQDTILNYDYYIIDQWGVLHNGIIPYSNKVVECLVNLKNANKKLIMLSNSSKRKDASYKGLEKVGIDPLLFDSIITSGEIGWNRLKNREFKLKTRKLQEAKDNYNSNIHYKLKVFVLGSGVDDEEYIESCNCILSTPNDADLIIARGTFSILDGIDNKIFDDADVFMNNIDSYLIDCARYNIPMLITNPDYYRPGTNSPMPGLIGERYKAIKSSSIPISLSSVDVDVAPVQIEYIGKPYELVYETCIDMLLQLQQQDDSIIMNNNINKDRICCIGDSIDHDIEGAIQASMHSIFITNGVHCRELDTIEGSSQPAQSMILQSFLDKYPHTSPKYILPNFQW